MLPIKSEPPQSQMFDIYDNCLQQKPAIARDSVRERERCWIEEQMTLCYRGREKNSHGNQLPYPLLNMYPPILVIISCFVSFVIKSCAKTEVRQKSTLFELCASFPFAKPKSWYDLSVDVFASLSIIYRRSVRKSLTERERELTRKRHQPDVAYLNSCGEKEEWISDSLPARTAKCKIHDHIHGHGRFYFVAKQNTWRFSYWKKDIAHGLTLWPSCPVCVCSEDYKMKNWFILYSMWSPTFLKSVKTWKSSSVQQPLCVMFLSQWHNCSWLL